MTKKILVGLIAALMLFAFVACDNSTPSVDYNDKTVKGIGYRVVGDNSYLAGEEFSLSNYEFYVIKADGTTAVIPASDLTADKTTLANTTAATTTELVTVKYLNSTTLTATVSVSVYPITDIEVTGTPATQYAAKGAVAGTATDATNFDKTGLVVTAQYKNGDTVVASRTLDEDEYTVTYDSQASAADTEQDATVKVNDTVSAAQPEDTIAIKTVLDTVDVDTIAIVAKEGFEPINYQAYTSGDYVVVGKTLSGEDLNATQIGTFGTLSALTFTDANTTNQRYTANSRITATFLPTGGNEYEDEVELSVGISPKSDYPVSVVASWATSAPTELGEGAQISQDLIKMTYTWASQYGSYGQEGSPVAPNVSFRVIPGTVTEKAGETQNVYVEVTNYDDVAVTYSAGTCLTFTVDDAL